MEKEILKENVVEAQTLFIGVGGTGCRIIKQVHDLCRPGEMENINFVFLDTNVNDLASVTREGAHIYFVQTSNTQTVGNYLDYDSDALQNWFPKNAVMYDKTVSEGAGQVRAISRLALNSTIKTGKIRPLYDAIDELFRKSGKALKQAMRVVIATTASGGTGSGILLPLSMFVRDYVNAKYPNTSLIVRSLILLPETLDSVIDSTVERESQRRNAYATIKEMNAFMMKGSGFFDINPDLKRYSDIHVDVANPGTDELKSLNLLPCDFCFLLDGQNAEDSTLVSTKQYVTQAAQALYEQNVGPMQKDAFSVEDNIIKELSNPGNMGRNRFGGIGAGVIRYPYEEIADYIAYDWAIKAIGGDGEASKWRKYDFAYTQKLAEGRKKGLSATELPERAEVYCDKMDNSGDNFSKDLRSKYLNKDAKKRLSAYFNALAGEMHKAIDNGIIGDMKNLTAHLSEEIDYKNDDAQRGKAKENLDLLRDYENAVRSNAKKVADSAAEAIFLNEQKTINSQQPYMLESILKNALGEICHPNAARYMLYLATTEMTKRVKSTNAQINDVVIPTLEVYSANANDPGTFDLKLGKGKTQRSIDELVSAESADSKGKGGGSEKLYTKLNACFTDYYSAISQLGELTAELSAYRFGVQYLRELNKAFEAFYQTFDEKISALHRKQDECVDYLCFSKGDSIFNVCASKELLEELARATAHQSEEGGLLESDLNGEIFDAVKRNAMFEREMQSADFIEEDRHVDVFDDILLGYFKKSVRRSCEMIDMNVIDAIAMENRLLGRIEMRNHSEGGKIVDKVSKEENERHIREVIAMGERLAAPGIQRITNEEPREVKLCAYNAGLKDMRTFRIDQLIPKGKDVDTVSKYELHFFNALYNLTPDKLNKFAAPRKTETRKRNAGLYHKAYMSYAKNIGPDSTKNMMISTHIDKRWDSIIFMPELDFDFQNTQIMKIHQALIYGLLYKAIVYQNLSSKTNGKMVYRYQNSNERMEELVVSNGTLCDEFYEILDALYIDAAAVEDIETICNRKRARDAVRKTNYENTEFFKAVREFRLEEDKEDRASLFEIPLKYYNSLPNALRYESEIVNLVDAVIKTYRDELTLAEKKDEVKFALCDVLSDEFERMVGNVKKHDLLSGAKVEDSVVVSIVERRIKDIIASTPEPDDYEKMIERMKQIISE